MPKEKTEKLLCVESLRHSEYYGMQMVFDKLYTKSKAGEQFFNLVDIILSRENVLLAYRNIKTNTGSRTPGTDRVTIEDVGKLPPEEVVEKVRRIVTGQKGYCPKPVRRKDIDKPNGGTRPLGIPCMWDRLIQQCIKQVMEPICEARFSDNSYGFRPNRSVEHAIQSTYKHIQNSNLHYVIEFDIKGFFDNVDHSKLIKQVWTLGIRDKHLIFILKRILKAPIKMPDGNVVYPCKGTPQGGIISPLLANIVLNELDHWVESQWRCNPVARNYATMINSNGSENLGTGYRAMRKTGLKEMYIVRYADDFRIFCRSKSDANKAVIAVTQWLADRLRLTVSAEKTRVVNVKTKYSEFLGFKIKVQAKGKKQVVKSHVNNKQLKKQRQKLVEQAKNIARPRYGKMEYDEIRLYDSMVLGMQEYYKIATDINLDCSLLQRAVDVVLKNRLGGQKSNRYVKIGRSLTQSEKSRYGKSAMLRYLSGTGEPIYPIGYVQHKFPMAKRRTICAYTPEGRENMHTNLRINVPMMIHLMRQPVRNVSVEYADNRISLFSAQWGRCAVTGEEFSGISQIHCHHKRPKSQGGTDEYGNLVLVHEKVHKLIHAVRPETIETYLKLLALDQASLLKLNKLREMAGYPQIK